MGAVSSFGWLDFLARLLNRHTIGISGSPSGVISAIATFYSPRVASCFTDAQNTCLGLVETRVRASLRTSIEDDLDYECGNVIVYVGFRHWSRWSVENDADGEKAWLGVPARR